MSHMANAVSAIPALGSGLGYRRELKQAILACRQSIDFLEIVADQFISDSRHLAELEEICDVFPVIPHGIGLSIGSITLDDAYLRAIKRVSDVAKSPYYSEHLAITRAPGIDIGHLSPLWLTPEVLETTVSNVMKVQEALGKPLVLENITYPFEIPGASMKQTEFFSRLVERTGCGLLLDVTNLYINSTNHHLDPLVFLKELPLDSLTQIHLAGGYTKDGMLIDSHSEAVEEGSWRLLEALSAMTRVKGSILEHDANFPDISVLVGEVQRARQIMKAGASATLAAELQ